MQNIQLKYNLAGIKAGFIKLIKKEIELSINRFRDGIYYVLTNVDMVTEGFDCPGIETVQVLRKN